LTENTKISEDDKIINPIKVSDEFWSIIDGEKVKFKIRTVTVIDSVMRSTTRSTTTSSSFTSITTQSNSINNQTKLPNIFYFQRSSDTVNEDINTMTSINQYNEKISSVNNKSLVEKIFGSKEEKEKKEAEKMSNKEKQRELEEVAEKVSYKKNIDGPETKPREIRTIEIVLTVSKKKSHLISTTLNTTTMQSYKKDEKHNDMSAVTRSVKIPKIHNSNQFDTIKSEGVLVEGGFKTDGKDKYRFLGYMQKLID